MRTCESCGAELTKPRRGPWPKTCGQRCRKRLSRVRTTVGTNSNSPYPVAMRALPRWTRAAGKRPITITGAPASTTNPSTWTRFAAVENDAHGIMLGDGLGCIDLDDCFTDTGELTPLAARIVAKNPKAFIEVSQSGKGLHIFGLRPEGPGIRRGGLEVYSWGRFIRTTGDIYQPGGLEELNV